MALETALVVLAQVGSTSATMDASGVTTAEDCAAAAPTMGGGIWNPEESGFVRFHRKLGDAPVFTNDMTAQGNYGSIRTLLQNAYGFDATTVASW